MKIGSVVKLKSGSPLMTVSSIGTDGEINVVWFELIGNSGTINEKPLYGSLRVDTFKVDVLEVVS